MKARDGRPLRIIQTIASAGEYTCKKLGRLLLQDEFGDEVISITIGCNGPIDITMNVLRKWLKSGAPTYQHLIECLEQSELGELAKDISAAVGEGTVLPALSSHFCMTNIRLYIHAKIVNLACLLEWPLYYRTPTIIGQCPLS